MLPPRRGSARGQAWHLTLPCHRRLLLPTSSISGCRWGCAASTQTTPSPAAPWWPGSLSCPVLLPVLGAPSKAKGTGRKNPPRPHPSGSRGALQPTWAPLSAGPVWGWLQHVCESAWCSPCLPSFSSPVHSGASADASRSCRGGAARFGAGCCTKPPPARGPCWSEGLKGTPRQVWQRVVPQEAGGRYINIYINISM